jgi:hypothetical protein
MRSKQEQTKMKYFETTGNAQTLRAPGVFTARLGRHKSGGNSVEKSGITLFSML